MREPLAYFLTWTTYGTWLPGDARGWVDGRTHEMHFAGDPAREEQARARMAETPVTLTVEQRDLVDRTIREHCRLRGWQLHEVNVRSNHVHVVVTAGCPAGQVMQQLKDWGTRRLKEACPGRLRWWTEKGSKRPVWTTDELEEKCAYVRDFQ